MFEVGDIIDRKYRVKGLCNDTGGMGTILFVKPLKGEPEYDIVLKYCKADDEESLKRFNREVRLLASFKDNSKIVQIVDRNLEYDPPYFVMKYYKKGDLAGLTIKLENSFEYQEKIFLQMIDCLQELHSRKKFHRDIKPQNFLLDGDQIVVSDFGLSTEVGSKTAFTRSSAFWGTHGYIPPEFLHGGFKHADAPGDIFMLGKTFYVLLTGRDPMYLVGDGIPPPIFHVIQRCCIIEKTNRYQTLAELKQSLVAAYDVLLGRAGGLGKVQQLLSAIQDRLKQNEYNTEEVSSFIEQLALLDESDQIRLCFELPHSFFSVIEQEPLIARLPEFLSIYERLVESRNYGWSYAETIADNMRILFKGNDVPVGLKARALDLAIHAAYYMNRFAAMDTCIAMVKSVQDEILGLEIATVLMSNRDKFTAGIEPSECQSESIRSALRQIKSSEAAMP